MLHDRPHQGPHASPAAPTAQTWKVCPLTQHFGSHILRGWCARAALQSNATPGTLLRAPIWSLTITGWGVAFASKTHSYFLNIGSFIAGSYGWQHRRELHKESLMIAVIYYANAACHGNIACSSLLYLPCTCIFKLRLHTLCLHITKILFSLTLAGEQTAINTACLSRQHPISYHPFSDWDSRLKNMELASYSKGKYIQTMGFQRHI